MDKERELDKLTIEDEIMDKRVSIAQKKAIEKEAKAKYGRDWRKILGYVRALKPNMEVIHDLYGMGLGHLRDLSDPRKIGRR